MVVDYLGNQYPSYEAFTRGCIRNIRRGRWLRDNGPFCRACGGTGKLDVHHSEYVENQLGNEPDDCLVALCHGRSCHIGGAHAYIDSGTYETRRAATAAFIRPLTKPSQEGEGEAQLATEARRAVVAALKALPPLRCLLLP